ncbi:T9SS type A sorting domain-containing protein [Tenacibaculum sp. 190524A05c]|uniref:T9SS type A sorting domain-containing protein n=1 Tax=Tenacibaculum platacis TaxID=3137852 RepID=UPI0031FB963A
MKHIYIILFLFVYTVSQGQIKSNSPWDISDVQRKGSKPTLKEVAKHAEDYFNSIDKFKKGSGLKPFKRWEYHWSHYLNEDGTFFSKERLWDAWRQKNALHQRSVAQMTDVSDWKPLGPYDSSTIFSSTKRIGQGRVNAIAVDPNNSNTYYVGAPAGGIWKSTDAGLNWTPLTDYLPQIGVSGIAIDPTNSNVIYIATGDDDASDSSSVGVWKSTDGGTTWNNTGGIPGDPNSMNEIYIHPTNTNIVLVATETGVQKTTNGGTTWTTKLSGDIIDLKMKPGDPNIWYAASSTNVYRSADGGESFTSVLQVTDSDRITMDVTIANPNYVYIVSSKPRNQNYAFNGIYKSTNSGASFVKTAENDDIFGSTQAWYDLALTVSDKNADIVYVGVLDIWKSTNGGDNFAKINDWRQVDQPSYSHADIHFMRFIDGKFFAGTDGGIYVSTNEGSVFTDLTKNIAISQFYRISISQQKLNVIAGGLQDNGGFGFDGTNWRHYQDGDGMEGIVNPMNANKFYGFSQYGGGLSITNDAGRTRTTRIGAPTAETGTNDGGGNWITPMAINKEGELYSGYSQIYKLVNDTSWEKVSNQFFGADFDRLVIDPTNSDIMYATIGASIFRTADRGQSFTRINFSSGTVRGIATNPNDPNSIWVATTNNVHKLSNITDASPTSETVGLSTPTEGLTALIRHERSGKNTLYIGTNLGVYYFNDDLTRWQTFDTNLPNVHIRDLEINEEDSRLYAATYGRGVFYTDIPRELPENDVRLLAIENTDNSILCGTTEYRPEIKVANQGTQAITSLTVNYNLDGGTNQVYNWTGNIASEAEATIILPEVSTTLGAHEINVETVLTNDAYNSNNSVTSQFSLNKSNSEPTTVNSFASAADELLVETSSGTEMWKTIGSSKTLLNIPTGRRAYATADGDYPVNTVGYLYTNCYDLTQITNPVFKFNMGFDIEQDWDYLVVEYTTDSGKNWEILGNAGDANWYNSNSTLNGLPGKQWTGEGEDVDGGDGLTNATIREYSHDLSALASETSIIFRFRFNSDQAVVEEGVILDDLVISGVLSTEDEIFLSGISVYPNPSQSIFNINRNTSDELTVKVFDITGKQVFYKKNATETSFEIDMSSHAKGIYIMNMVSNGRTATKKLILK